MLFDSYLGDVVEFVELFGFSYIPEATVVCKRDVIKIFRNSF